MIDYAGKSVEDMKNLLEYECGESDADCLTRTVTEEEIKGMLFAMPRNKAPGPNGFTGEFLKKHCCS